jgi:transposase
MDILHDCCAGLDVHKKTVVVCVLRAGPDGKASHQTRTFATMTADLLELADWLASMGVRHAAMESTGVYWKPIWHLLEGRFELTLVNARHMRQVPGRKTDVKDARWIAQLLQHGLLWASFVPPPPIRELRDLTRQRAQLVADRAAAANRVQKVLESANIKLSSVASDVLGVSGRAMIARMIAGQSDAATLAGEARGSLRKKVVPLTRALEGRVTDHHRFQLRLLMDQIGQLEQLIARLDARVIQVMEAREPDRPEMGEAREPDRPDRPPPPPPLAEAAARLATIPGIGQRSAEVIVAEIGPDMTRFATAGHLASWAGLSPGNDQSAGKRRSGRTTKGSQWLRVALVQAAWAASHTKGTVLTETYRRWAKRLGKKKALVALGHKLLRVIHKMLSQGTDYVEHQSPGLAA